MRDCKCKPLTKPCLVFLYLHQKDVILLLFLSLIVVTTNDVVASLDYIPYVPLTKTDFRQYSQHITEWDYNFPSSCPQTKGPSFFVAVHAYSSIFNSFQRILPLCCFTMMVEQVNGMILSGPSGLSMLVRENKLNGNSFVNSSDPQCFNTF